MKKYILVTACELDNFKPHFKFFDRYEEAEKEAQEYTNSISRYPANSIYNIYKITD